MAEMNVVGNSLIIKLFFQVSKWYDLVIFTASMEIYGAAVADKLDNNRGILTKRYYRQVYSIYLLYL